MSTSTQNTTPISSVGDDVNKGKEDNDPQTIFYLNRILAASSQQAIDTPLEDIWTTLYFWAPRIEQTVQQQLGNDDIHEHHSLKASWERAAYRVRLVDHLARTTPWLANGDM